MNSRLTRILKMTATMNDEFSITYPQGQVRFLLLAQLLQLVLKGKKRKAFLDTWPPAIVFFFLKHVFGQSFRDKFSWSFLWIRQTNEYQARTNILHEVWKERNLSREIKVPTYRISLSKRLPRINRLFARPWYQTSAPSDRFPLSLTPPLS